MSRLTGQRSFAGLLELARGETDWRRLRAYLGVFESYSVYLSLSQKVQTLAFLYELLMHREGDIRRQAAALMGEIIARFHAGYVKETPKDYVPDSRDNADLDQWRLYLEKIVYPDRKLMPQHRRWITFTLKMVVNSLLEKCTPERRGEFLRSFLRYYRAPERLGDETAFQLLETATALPFAVCDERQRRRLMHFAQALSVRKDLTVRSAAVLLLSALHPWLESSVPGALRSVDCAGSASLARLRDTALAGAGVQAPPPPPDEPDPGKAILFKRDANTNKGVGPATFKFSSVTNGVYEFDTNASGELETIQWWDPTEKAGKYIKPGEYAVSEIVPPPNYESTTEVQQIKLELDADGNPIPAGPLVFKNLSNGGC